MTVFVLIEEYQNEHGFVDTSIAGVFQHRQHALDREAAARIGAREQGMLVEGEDCPDGDWQLAWKIVECDVN